MNLDQALDTLHTIPPSIPAPVPSMQLQALNLGAHAIRRLQELRRYPHLSPTKLLTGETKE